jgi:hypothetical protein
MNQDKNSMKYYIFGAHSRGQTLKTYLKWLHQDWEILGFLYDNDEKNPKEIDSIPVIRLTSAGQNDKEECFDGSDCITSLSDRENFSKLDTDADVYVGTRGINFDHALLIINAAGFKHVFFYDQKLDTELRNQFVPKYFEAQGRNFIRLDDYMPEDRHDADNSVNVELVQDCSVAKKTAESNHVVYIVKSAYDKDLVDNRPLFSYERYIQAGKALSEKRLEECSFFDDKADNISMLNRQFCELTAMYWIWKNAKADVVGLEQYRRRFLLPEDWHSAFDSGHIDAVLPVPLYVHPSLAQNYRDRHTVKTWEVMLDELKRYPEMIIEAEDFFENNGCYSPCNMLIAKKEVLDELCTWLFPILFKVTDKIGQMADSYQNRYPGFLSERLISYWFYHKRNVLKVVYADKVFLT